MDQMRVLLIDDEEELVYTVAERLKIREIHADAVTNGEDGIKMVEDNEYDVVLLDVRMPGLDGIDVMKRIHRLRPDLPVILITGHGSAHYSQSGMEEGAFDYVMKPIHIKDLVKKLQAAREHAKKRR